MVDAGNAMLAVAVDNLDVDQAATKGLVLVRTIRLRKAFFALFENVDF